MAEGWITEVDESKELQNIESEDEEDEDMHNDAKKKRNNCLACKSLACSTITLEWCQRDPVFSIDYNISLAPFHTDSVQRQHKLCP